MEMIEKMNEIVNIDENSHVLEYSENLTLLVDALKSSDIMGKIGLNNQP